MKKLPERSEQALHRRTMLGTAATAGAAVAATSWLATKVQDAAPSATPVAPVVDTSKGGGYQLSDHVKHYYRTARI